MQRKPFHIGPDRTPKAIKILMLITAVLSFVWAISLQFFPYFAFHTLQYILGLTVYGIKHGFIWEFVTFFFVQPSQGLTFTFFLDLAFKLYLLWVFGTSLIQMKGTKQFLTLFLSGGIVTGIFAFILMALFLVPQPLLGSQATIFTVLIAWMILNPHARVYLFFTLPVNINWLVLGIWGINLILDLVQGNFISFAAYLAAGLYGYLYALMIWKAHSPFPFLHGFENALMHMKKKKREKSPKVYDFSTGKPLKGKDEVFMDEMLQKISKEGEESLTKKERKRMNAIAKKKRKS